MTTKHATKENFLATAAFHEKAHFYALMFAERATGKTREKLLRDAESAKQAAARCIENSINAPHRGE